MRFKGSTMIEALVSMVILSISIALIAATSKGIMINPLNDQTLRARALSESIFSSPSAYLGNLDFESKTVLQDQFQVQAQVSNAYDLDCCLNLSLNVYSPEMKLVLATKRIIEK